jgi:hypothetical protein
MTYVLYPEIPGLPDISLNPAIENIFEQHPTSCFKNGIEIINTTNNRYELNPDFITWVKKNISSEFTGIGFNHMGTCDGGTTVPHTDRKRHWTLMWIFETGGDDVNTIFWKEQGHTIERDITYYPRSYDNLIELERHVIEPNRWVLVNAKVIHSVENMTSIRKSIQIGFLDNSSFIKQLNLCNNT